MSKSITDDNTLIYFDNLLEEWVINNTDPTEIKACNTRRYIVGNAKVASLFGMTPDEMIGLDVNTIASLNNLKSSFIERINEADYTVLQKRQLIRFKHVFFTHDHHILIEIVTKRPIFNHKNKVIAILNYTRDITHSIDLFVLFLHYEDLYCKRLKQTVEYAINAFLKYLKLDCLFIKLPTRQELMILLMMRRTSYIKDIAKKMKMSPKIVDIYKSNIFRKLFIPNLLLPRLSIQYELDKIE